MCEKDATFQAGLPCANAIITLGRSDSDRCVRPSQSAFLGAHPRATGQDPGLIANDNWLAAWGRSTDLHLWYAPSWEEIEAAENRPADGGQGPVISVVDFTDNDMVQRREE